jgi:hypothetical protein
MTSADHIVAVFFAMQKRRRQNGMCFITGLLAHILRLIVL